MTGFNHVLAGTLLAVVLPAPIAPFVAFISHFVLDALPHWGNDKRLLPWNFNNKFFNRYLTLEAILSASVILLALVIFSDKILIILLCAFLAFSPDILWPLKGRYPFLNKYFDFHKRIQMFEKPNNWYGDALFFVSGFTSLLVLGVML